MAAISEYEEPPLQFAQSESTLVGMQGRLVGMLRENAPRIVGAMKLVGDITVGLSDNPFLIAYSVFAVTGRLILMGYGTKDNQRRQAAKLAAENRENTPPDLLGKITRPSQYPVEASSGVSSLAELFCIAAGIGQYMTDRTGITLMVLGTIGSWSYANILFSKEGKDADEKAGHAPSSAAPQEPLQFAESESTGLGFTGTLREKMRENPVMVSSLMQLGISFFMLAGGIIEGLKPNIVIAAGIFIVANLMQALFVSKKGFNVEGAQEENALKPSFAERIAASRGGDLGMQPA